MTENEFKKLCTKDAERGTGRTTRGMSEAPDNAMYVWCNEQLHYPRDLARDLGRCDLKIVGPAALSPERMMGLRLPVVLDHATYTALTPRQRDAYDYCLRRIEK